MSYLTLTCFSDIILFEYKVNKMEHLKEFLKKVKGMQPNISKEEVKAYDPVNEIGAGGGLTEKKRLISVVATLQKFNALAESADFLYEHSKRGVQTDMELKSFLVDARDEFNAVNDLFHKAPELDCVNYAAYEILIKGIKILRDLVQCPVMNLVNPENFNLLYREITTFEHRLSENVKDNRFQLCRFEVAMQWLLLTESIKNSTSPLASSKHGFWGNGSHEETYYKFLTIAISPRIAFSAIVASFGDSNVNFRNHVTDKILIEHIKGLYETELVSV